MPRSSAISRRVLPLITASRTASRRNSGVGLFPFPIEHLLVPQLVLSTFSGQVHACVEGGCEIALPLVLATRRQLTMTRREWTPLNKAIWLAEGNPPERKRTKILTA